VLVICCGLTLLPSHLVSVPPPPLGDAAKHWNLIFMPLSWLRGGGLQIKKPFTQPKLCSSSFKGPTHERCLHCLCPLLASQPPGAAARGQRRGHSGRTGWVVGWALELRQHVRAPWCAQRFARGRTCCSCMKLLRPGDSVGRLCPAPVATLMVHVVCCKGCWLRLA
jgi:hypothetical protein